MPRAESFEAKLDELEELVGLSAVVGRVEVDQVYAQFQHEGLDLKHPRGGQAKYLEQPLFDDYRSMVQRLADHVLDGGLDAAMADNMEHLSGEVFRLAPVEFFDLRASGHPTVDRGGVIVYDRPPAQPRLTPEQLKAKDKLRRVGSGGFGGLGSLYGY